MGGILQGYEDTDKEERREEMTILLAILGVYLLLGLALTIRIFIRARPKTIWTPIICTIVVLIWAPLMGILVLLEIQHQKELNKCSHSR